MLHALTAAILAVEAEKESSKTAFYIFGGILAGWAVVLGALGMSQPGFPGSATAQRGVMGISFVLMAAAMATAVITA